MKLQRVLSVSALAGMVLLSTATAAFAKDYGVIDIAYQATVAKDASADTMEVIPKAYVNMYKVTVSGYEYVGKRVKTLGTGKDGYQAVFVVKPGDVVQFIAYKNKLTALKAKNKIKKSADFLGVPPWKYFSEPGMPLELCLTAGVDFSKKLTDEATGKALCSTGENGYIEGYLELTKS